jgi:ribose transport system ATP-binding protein
MDGVPAARVANLVKRFGQRDVLSGVSLTVAHGQVHALLGANGAGKSSLVKILAGYYTRDVGAIFIGDAPAPPSSGVAMMAALGVRVVHQDLGLIDGLSILENVAAGDGYIRGPLGLIDWRATARRVTEALRIVGLPLDPWAEVDRLPTWQRVAVACARALFDGLDEVRLLILDEVTAALPPGEVVQILDVVRRLQALGAGIVYVTHRFEEVIEIADWVTVLRNGTVFESRPIAGVTPASLVESVAGHTVTTTTRAAGRGVAAAPVLAMEGVTTARLRDISLSIREGEICGVIGRAGCGRSALGRTVFGLERVQRGRMTLRGAPLAGADPSAAIERGVAYVPQDRQRAGILPGASLRENLAITNLAAASRFGLMRGEQERRIASDLVATYGIVPPDFEERIENFSGGNQQKAVVGRWGRRKIALFILDEPTEGVDAGAREAIYGFIRASAASGTAILLLSSSLEEVVQICDRALLLRDGRIAEEIAGERLSVREVEHLVMAGP